jgi:hypothetical protein
MKVISAPPMTWKCNDNCSNCNAELEIDLGDLQRVFGSDCRGDSWDYLTFTCPICKRNNTLNQIVPKHLRDNIVVK